MLTGEIRNQIDRIWDAFWSGGISNPLEVIEQITYLLFLRRLDNLQALEENKATRLGKAIERRIFPKGRVVAVHPVDRQLQRAAPVEAGGAGVGVEFRPDPPENELCQRFVMPSS
jgi:hypothetical protein